MIALNLLPDIKKEYLRTQKFKRMFTVGSLIAMAVFVTVTVLLGIFVFAVQRLQLSNTQSDIDGALSQLQSIEDLDKIVTVQKQLEVLPELHKNKPAVYRLFDYLKAVIPNDVSLSKVEFAFLLDGSEGGTLTGSAPDPKSVNILVDTLKNAQLTYDGAETSIKPFQTVILDKTNVDDGGVSYSVIIKFDPTLFDNSLEKAKLTVPKITTSSSVTERPALFNEESED
ncbi:MAG TPA: hypothetical protein VF996_01050 [Candidatus Saccharimonadales bacterium]|jgi:Tfp pilus assembly protein PilN